MIYAFQRIFPLTQQIYNSVVSINSYSRVYESFVDSLIVKKMFNKNKQNNISNINIKKLNYSYNSSTNFYIPNLQLKKGDFVFITGKSGSGKTTIIELITGLVKADSGEVFVNNKINNNLYLNSVINNSKEFFYNGEVLDQFYIYRKKISLKKIKNLLTTTLFFNSHSKTKSNGMELNNDVKKLSTGQLQRLAISRSLSMDSELIIFDEATNDIDALTENQIFKNLKFLLKDKIVIYISHNRDLKKYCNKSFEIINGELIAT